MTRELEILLKWGIEFDKIGYSTALVDENSVYDAMREYAREMSIGFARFLGDYCIQYIDHAEVWTYTKDDKDYNLNELYAKYLETLNK